MMIDENEHFSLSALRRYMAAPRLSNLLAKEPSMSEQCECANMDWSDVAQTLAHHPKCNAANVDGFTHDGFIAQIADSQRAVDWHSVEITLPPSKDKQIQVVATADGKIEKRTGWKIPGRDAVSALDSDLQLMFVCNLIAGGCWPDLGNCSIAPTGEGYITFNLGGELAEGEPVDIHGATPRAARASFLKSFIDYANKHTGALYWREYPNLAMTETKCSNPECVCQMPGMSMPHRICLIWARFIISDKPITEQS